jgi:hypothetical protein
MGRVTAPSNHGTQSLTVIIQQPHLLPHKPSKMGSTAVDNGVYETSDTGRTGSSSLDSSMACRSEAPLSVRGAANIDSILPKITAQLAERMQTDNPKIDMSTSENWLMREELVKLYKDAIVQKLKPSVRSSCGCNFQQTGYSRFAALVLPKWIFGRPRTPRGNSHICQ